MLLPDRARRAAEALIRASGRIAARTRQRPANAPVVSEHSIQVSVIQWWFYACHRWGLPFFALFAIPNGGARHPAVAGKLKAEGVRAGIPDLMLAVPVVECSGLFIEMKSARGNLSPDQRLVASYLRDQGYRVAVCRTLEEAIDTIKHHLHAYARPTWLPTPVDPPR